MSQLLIGLSDLEFRDSKKSLDLDENEGICHKLSQLLSVLGTCRKLAIYPIYERKNRVNDTKKEYGNLANLVTSCDKIQGGNFSFRLPKQRGD